MTLPAPAQSITVAAYTAYPWPHALPTLRLVDPLHFAGLRLVQGNDETGIYPERVSQADLVVIQRDFPRWEAEYKRVMEQASLEQKPVVYETDDWLLELPPEHPDTPIDYYTPALFPILHAILSADAVTTTTPALCTALRPLNRRVYRLPNYLDDRLWQVHLDPPALPDSPVTIGYMGSTTHLPDLQAVLPVLGRLLDRHGDRLRLQFWGGPPPEPLRARPQVGWVDLQLRDYAEFARYFSQQACHIFIAPLVDSEFNRCKSAIKFYEYSALSVPGVYSRMPPFQEVVRHGENGFLAGELDEWESCLERLVQDPGLRLEMGARAAEYVRLEGLLSQHAGQWAAVYRAVLEQPADGRLANRQSGQVILSVAAQVNAWQSRDLQSRLAAAEAALGRLQAERDALHASRGWAFLQALLRLRRRLIPEGSQRERLLYSMLRRLG